MHQLLHAPDRDRTIIQSSCAALGNTRLTKLDFPEYDTISFDSSVLPIPAFDGLKSSSAKTNIEDFWGVQREAVQSVCICGKDFEVPHGFQIGLSQK